MKSVTAIFIAIILMAVSISTGSVFAQDAGNDVYPVETEPTPDPTEEPDEPNPICEDGRTHPAIARIADQYNMAYEELLGYFCEYDFGVGEIALMLNTFTQAEGEMTLEEILAMRVDEESGWGEIWQELGLIGSGKNQSGEQGKPESFERNQNRDRYNHQAANGGGEFPLNNGNKPLSPPGLEKDKNQGNGPKGNGHPGNGKKP